MTPRADKTTAKKIHCVIQILLDDMLPPFGQLKMAAKEDSKPVEIWKNKSAITSVCIAQSISGNLSVSRSVTSAVLRTEETDTLGYCPKYHT
jgi:hypothetical protein